MPRVLADLAGLADGEVYALVTPFVPAPLVDLARGKGFLAFSATEGEARVRTYFRRAEAEVATARGHGQAARAMGGGGPCRDPSSSS